jgi:transcriptional regulator with XRE-family HTH domain
MSKGCENRYKVCRTAAGITQERAAELLGVASRTMSDYENGHARVPDDIVATMAEIYKSPLLAWWHLQQTSILGKYLPDIVMPQTHGDMAFQLILAKDDLEPTVKTIKSIMANGRIDDHEQGDFNESMEMVRKVNAKLLSVIIYAGGGTWKAQQPGHECRTRKRE